MVFFVVGWPQRVDPSPKRMAWVENRVPLRTAVETSGGNLDRLKELAQAKAKSVTPWQREKNCNLDRCEGEHMEGEVDARGKGG